jgi:hypothetical protein
MLVGLCDAGTRAKWHFGRVLSRISIRVEGDFRGVSSVEPESPQTDRIATRNVLVVAGDYGSGALKAFKAPHGAVRAWCTGFWG